MDGSGEGEVGGGERGGTVVRLQNEKKNLLNLKQKQHRAEAELRVEHGLKWSRCDAEEEESWDDK